MTAKEKLNELDWLAFLFVAGEMSDADSESFELRLAGDQAAREAVARQVELTQTIAAASVVEPLSETAQPVVAARQTADWWSAAAWLAAASAACLLGVSIYYATRPATRSHSDSPRDGDATVAGVDATLSPQLAFAWLETRDELSLVGDDADFSLPVTDENAEDSLNADSFASDDEQLAAPDWMLAAVSGLKSSVTPLQSESTEPR